MEKTHRSIRIPSWLWYSIVIGSYYVFPPLGYFLTVITLFTIFMLPSMMFTFMSNILRSEMLSIEELESQYEEFMKHFKSKSSFRILWVTIFKYNTVWIWRDEFETRLENAKRRILSMKLNVNEKGA